MEPVIAVHPVGCDFTLLVPSRHQAVYEDKGYERYSSVLFQASCVDSDTVIDIGAHMGYYTLLAHQANPRARITAVEASPDNYRVLEQNVMASGAETIRTINAAFGDTTGTVVIQLTEASDNSSIAGHPDSPTLATCEVRAIAGVDLGELPASLLTVKVDVEGHEVRALQGLEEILGASSDTRLFVEFNPKCLEKAGSSPAALLEWLFDHGYRLFLLHEDERRWAELREGQPWTSLINPAGYGNLYCVPAERALTVSAVLHSSGSAGAERQHVEMVEALVRQGALVDTILPLPDLGGVGDALAHAGSSITWVPGYPWWMVGSDAARGEASTGTEWRRGLVDAGVIAAIAAADPDVVITQTGVVPQGAVAAAILDKPHVWFLHEYGDKDHDLVLPAESPSALGVLMEALSAEVVTNSEAVRAHFFPESRAKVSVVAPAPHLDAFSGLRRTERPTTVGIVASLNPGKGHEDALVAAAELRATGLDVPLVFVGDGPPVERARLHETARRLGVEDLVTLSGVMRDRTAAYSLFDVVAVTSRSEAFGRIPFEAAAAGIPVIYAEAGGLTEFMKPGETGLGYRPGDAAGLAEAIRSLVMDASLRERLVAGAQRSLCDPHRWAAFANSVGAVLRRAAAQPSDIQFRVLKPWLGASGAAMAARCVESERQSKTSASELERVTGEYEPLQRQFDELRVDHERVNLAYAELWADRENLRSEHAVLQEEHASLVEEHASLREEHASLREEHASLVEEHASLVEEHASLVEEHASLVEEHASLREEHARVLGSRTWRSTRLIRRAAAVLRRSR